MDEVRKDLQWHEICRPIEGLKTGNHYIISIQREIIPIIGVTTRGLRIHRIQGGVLKFNS